jgi:hypothetical protein
MTEQHLAYEAKGVAAVINGAVFFGAGHLFGSAIGSDPMMMAQAMLVYSLANTILHGAVDFAAGGCQKSPQLHSWTILLGECAIGIAHIFGLRQFQLIADWGSIFLAFALHTRTLYRLSNLSQTLEAVH